MDRPVDSVARAVKKLHGHHCQVCGVVVLTPSGPYAEGAHIRPLGVPHFGPDEPENLLCLCANCHVRFDTGAIHVDDRWSVIDTLTGAAIGRLRIAGTHLPSSAHLDYHRVHVAETGARANSRESQEASRNRRRSSPAIIIQ